MEGLHPGIQRQHSMTKFSDGGADGGKGGKGEPMGAMPSHPVLCPKLWAASVLNFA